MELKKGYRVEKDSIGQMYVPEDAYYGIQSLRAKENFSITKTKIHKQLINGIAMVKKAAFLANNEVGLIDDTITAACVQACDEILKGKWHGQVICDAIQGGAGTSMNMNLNEVIANRANEILGQPLGSYSPVHPNDHCNYGQSTNDVIPTSGKVAIIKLANALLIEVKKLNKALWDKAVNYRSVIKMGRTHLQDAVPISVGQEFGAFASALERDAVRLQKVIDDMKDINMGATAVGTGLNADPNYIVAVVRILATLTGEDFVSADDLVDSTRNLDGFLAVSSALKIMAVNLSKTANDLRLMASGPTAGFSEIFLPMKQPGSSIMPGKVNPVIPEVVNQVCFQVFGNDLVITKAAEAGQLELNVFEPVLFKNLFESLDILRRGIKTLRENALEGLTVNKERCISYVERSAGIVTALAPHLGYEICSSIAKQALKEDRSVASIVLEKNLMSEEDLNIILDARNMTSPGIAGKEIMAKKAKKTA